MDRATATLVLLLFGVFLVGGLVAVTGAWATMVRLRKYHRETWEEIGGPWWDYRLMWWIVRGRFRAFEDPRLDRWAAMAAVGYVVAFASWLGFAVAVIWWQGLTA